MKKLYIFIVFILLIALTSCSNNQLESEPLDVVSNSIRNDIASMPIVQEGHIKSVYTPFDTYTIDDISIIKRSLSEDGKKDTVFCKVVMHNTYYQTTFEVELKYSFYEVGGWLLDDANILSTESIPLRGIEENNIIELRIELRPWVEQSNAKEKLFEEFAEEFCRKDGQGNRYYANSYICNQDCFSLQSRNFDALNYIDTLYYSYCEPDKDFELYGYVTFIFNQNDGWVLQNNSAWDQADGRAFVQITDVDIDWGSVMNGQFLFEANANLYRANISLDIYDFDSFESALVTYENALKYYENGTLRSGKYAYESAATLSKTDFTITFNYTVYYADILGHPSEEIGRKVLYYNFLNNSWVEKSTYNLNLIRIE